MFIIILSTQHIPPVFTPMWESVDRWKKTGQHSKRQLQQPQYCKAGLMGHVWMQQRGTSSCTCAHICWINEEIFPKSTMYVDRWSEIMGKDVCIHVRYVCVCVGGVTVCLLVGLKKQQHTDHWSSGVCTHIHFCHAVGRSDSSLSRIVLFYSHLLLQHFGLSPNWSGRNVIPFAPTEILITLDIKVFWLISPTSHKEDKTYLAFTDFFTLKKSYNLRRCHLKLRFSTGN